MLSTFVFTFPFPARVIPGENRWNCASIEIKEKVNRSIKIQDNFFIGKRSYCSNKGKKSENKKATRRDSRMAFQLLYL
jgi:hypothetical protein